MNRSDTFVIHKRHLYTYGANRRPFGMGLTYSQKSNQNLDPDPENEPSLFIVDWQMQNVEIDVFEGNSILGARMEFHTLNNEVKNSDQDLRASDKLTYNCDW